MKSYVLISGGLGNQMFQYAFLLSLKAKGYDAVMDLMPYQWEKAHNGYELDRVFGISENMNCSSFHKYMYVFLKRIKSKYILSDYLDYYDDETLKNRLFYDGFWQIEKYFHDIEDEVRKAFTFKNVDSRNLDVVYQMRKENAVSVHFRRGDYLTIPRLMVCDDEYYKNSISYIKENVPSPMFYVFSNDIEWSDGFMRKLHVPYQIIDFNQGQDSFRDMYLMTQCKHNIIANSSFSWWGAYLNSCSQKIVVSPKEWNRRVPGFHPQLDDWVEL